MLIWVYTVSICLLYLQFFWVYICCIHCKSDLLQADQVLYWLFRSVNFHVDMGTYCLLLSYVFAVDLGLHLLHTLKFIFIAGWSGFILVAFAKTVMSPCDSSYYYFSSKIWSTGKRYLRIKIHTWNFYHLLTKLWTWSSSRAFLRFVSPFSARGRFVSNLKTLNISIIWSPIKM